MSQLKYQTRQCKTHIPHNSISNSSLNAWEIKTLIRVILMNLPHQQNNFANRPCRWEISSVFSCLFRVQNENNIFNYIALLDCKHSIRHLISLNLNFFQIIFVKEVFSSSLSPPSRVHQITYRCIITVHISKDPWIML